MFNRLHYGWSDRNVAPVHRSDGRSAVSDDNESCFGKWFGGSLVTLVLAVVVNPMSVAAAEWTLMPDIQVTGTYNDNIILAVDPVSDVFGAILDLGVPMGARSERSELKFTPLFRFNRYTGEEGLDSDDQFFYLTGSHAVTERATAALDMNFSRNTTLNSELLTTGRVIAGIRRETFDVAPSFDYAMSERNLLRFGYLYRDVNYDADPVTTGLIDYKYQLAEATGIRELSARDEISATVLASRFEAPDLSNTTDSYGFQASYAHAFSETLNGSVALGVTASDIELSGISIARTISSTDPTWEVRLNKRFEYTKLGGRLRRFLLPTGSGTLVLRDQLDLSLERQLGSRMAGDITVTAYRNRALEGVDVSRSREVLRVLVRLTRRLSKRLRLTGEYRFLQSDTDTRPAADSHAVFVYLSYEGQGWAWSR